MEQRIVDKKFLNRLRLYALNRCSILYINGDDLIKMPYADNKYIYMGKQKNSEFEKTLEALEVLDGKYYILPKYSLYTSKIKTSNYKGYGMDYLKDYKTIGTYIESDKYTHKEKLEICKKLCDIITRLEKYKLAYWDIHSENVLINEDKNIKLCDMDSVTPSSIYGEIEYKGTLIWSYRHLTSLVLAILYGMDENDLIAYTNENRNVKFIKESPMFQVLFEKETHIFYPDKYLDVFTEDYVEETKLILKKDN